MLALCKRSCCRLMAPFCSKGDNPSMKLSNTIRGHNSQSMPLLNVSPQVALVDEKVSIICSRLQPLQKVTIKAWLEDGRAVFGACAHFVADSRGCVDITKDSSLGGTYTGIDSMGLFWSLKSVPGLSTKARLVKTDVTTPFIVSLTLLADHVQFEDLVTQSPTVLATGECQRWYKKASVRRTVIKEGGVRGTLFLPTGSGPFRGVIDMFGSTGGIVEFRAALLASHGYAAFALPYFNYDDLPTDIGDLDMRYFLNAVDWFSGQSFVQSQGIGLVGVSKGGEIAFLMGSLSDKVTAIVNISGSPTVSLVDFKLDGKVFTESIKFEPEYLEQTGEGVIFLNCFRSEKSSAIPVWKNNAHILYLCGDDDKTWQTRKLTDTFVEQCPLEKRGNIEVVIYPRAGHLIEPPYMPLCRVSYHKIMSSNVVWGGIPAYHAWAQEDAWKRLLHFMDKYLRRPLTLDSNL